MIVYLTLVSILAATISGLVGMAGGILLLAAMSLVMPIQTVVPIHGLVQLMSNFSRTMILIKDVHRSICFHFAIGVPFGGFLGYLLLSHLQRPTWILALVALILLYVVFKPEKAPEIKLPLWAFALLGMAAATLSSLVGATGPFLAPFFVRSDLSKESMVATKASCQIAVHLVKIPVFMALSFNYLDHWLLILCMVLGVIVGTKLGTSLLRKVSRPTFLRVLKVAMFLIALRLLYKSLAVELPF